MSERDRSPSVSTVIPTFERADLVGRALASVFAQIRPADEVLVVDDGSTDGTAALVRHRFPAARCLRQEHRGVSAARNRGIAAATGEWIALLDSDDEWLPEKLERQLAALARQPALRVCHSDEIWRRNGRRVNPRRRHCKRGGWIFRHCLPLCAISPSSALIHRSVFDEVGAFDESLPAGEDYDLWLRICARMPVLFVDEPLVVKHGGHDDQLSRRVWGLDRFRIRALEKVLEAGGLAPRDEAAARRTLLAKIEIYLNGARRRGKAAQVALYADKLRRWRRGEAAACQPASEPGAGRTAAAGGGTDAALASDRARPEIGPGRASCGRAAEPVAPSGGGRQVGRVDPGAGMFFPAARVARERPRPTHGAPWSERGRRR